MLHLEAVAVDDGDGDDAYEAVEGVELWQGDLVAPDEERPQDDLDEHGGLGEADEPPQGPGAQAREPVGTQGPQPGQAVADDHHPRPTLVEVEEGFQAGGEHQIESTRRTRNHP